MATKSRSARPPGSYLLAAACHDPKRRAVDSRARLLRCVRLLRVPGPGFPGHGPHVFSDGPLRAFMLLVVLPRLIKPFFAVSTP